MGELEYSIREIGYAEVLPLWQELWAEKPKSIRPTSAMLFEGGFDGAIHQSFRPFFFGAFVGSQLIGVNSGHPTSPLDFRSRGLYVLPEHRGRGLGRILLRRMVDHARDRDFALIWSYPRDSSWRTYETSGFQKQERKLRAEDKNNYAYIELKAGVLSGRQERGYSPGEHWIEGVLGRLNEVSPSLCLANWTHRTLNLQTSEIRTCCYADSQTLSAELTMQAMIDHDGIRRSQDEMLLGKRPDSCRSCWKMENSSHLSDRAYLSSRRWVWKQFGSVISGSSDTNQWPQHLEITFDNLCQMKCSYCGPAASSSWENELTKFGLYPTGAPVHDMPIARKFEAEERREQRGRQLRAFWDAWPKLGNQLKYLHVLGGEPLLSSEAQRLLDDLAERPRPNLNLIINSNLNHGPARIHAFLEKAKRIQSNVARLMVFTSIDSVGAQAEYIRYGLNVDRFFSCVEAILSGMEAEISMEFIVTTGCLSLPGLAPLMERIQGLRERFPRHTITCDPNLLREPSFMRASILPPHFISYIDAALAYMERMAQDKVERGFSRREISKMVRIRDFMERGEPDQRQLASLRSNFYRWFREYDRRRGTGFLTTFPEYEDFWRACETQVNLDHGDRPIL